MRKLYLKLVLAIWAVMIISSAGAVAVIKIAAPGEPRGSQESDRLLPQSLVEHAMPTLVDRAVRESRGRGAAGLVEWFEGDILFRLRATYLLRDGTGKTLLTLAGALEQRRDFRQIYMARPIVPLSNRDIGYLPGDVHSKIDPYMQPLWDNLSFIKNQFERSEREYQTIEEMVESKKLEIIPLAYIRGRTFSNLLFIVDEAQNLTPHEVKTIITRAGEGAKIILTGDIFQIDTPYLDSQSNGLSFLIDRLKGSPLYAHVILEKGERSLLANLASELL